MAAGAAFNIGGLVSGLDTNSIISKLISLQSINMQSLQGHLTTDTQQLTDLRTIEADASNLKSSSDTLGLASTFAVTSATSSDSTVLSATAGTGAIAGNYPITVNQVAQGDQMYLNTTYDDDTTAVAKQAGAINLTVGAGGYTVNVAADASLTDIAADINNAGIPVQASIVDQGSSSAHKYTLLLTSEKTGQTTGNVTWSDTIGHSGGSLFSTSSTGSTGFSYLQKAQDAQVTLGSSSTITITSSSNTITSAIPGVSLNLVKASTSAITVNVAADTTAIQNQINAFITNYNQMVDDLQKVTYIDPSGVQPNGSLASDSTISYVTGSLADAVTSPIGSIANTGYDVANGIVGSLGSLGIELDAGGHLVVKDSAMLTQQLSTNLANVTQFFTKQSTSTDPTQGWSQIVSGYLNDLTVAGTGQLTLADQHLVDEQTQLTSQISEQSDYLARQTTFLQNQFNAMEAALGQYQAQSQAFAAQFGTQTGSTSSSSSSSSSS
jgi:flagellar hook-associated protein 2